jgi:hypothetical protein
MNNNPLLKSSLLLATGLLLSAGAAHAALYHVSVNTSALTTPANSGNGPFSIDFQLNSGGTLGNNTAVISSFIFNGGGAPFGPANLLGGASGSLSGSITLTDSNPFNEFYQEFTPGASFEFDLNLTENVDAGGIPDSFSFAILDGSGFNIPTTGFGDSLFQVDLNPSSQAPNISGATGSYLGVVAVPEPSSAFLGLAALGLGLIRRRRVA